MNISTLNFYSLNIPFKEVFTHSSASRNITETIWIEAKIDNGLTGYGEACPRYYVTSESMETAHQFYEVIKARLLEEVHNIDDLLYWTESKKKIIDQNPAAWCAVELALLDLFAKSEQVSVEKLLGLPELGGTFQYSAVLGDSNIDIYRARLSKYVAIGFKDYKIKISGDLEKDQAKLECFKVNNQDTFRVRLDANNLWRDPADVIGYIRSLGYPVWAIEEPLEVNNFEGFLQITKELNIKIILDESFLRVDQIEMLNNNEDMWIVNLRVSKMGGLIRSKKILEMAMQKGIGLIIGAQVGESSLLTRAALTAAQYIKNNLLAHEGAFGTHLLSDDIVDPSLMFGNEGKLDTDKFDLHTNHGFGLSMKPINEYLELV